MPDDRIDANSPTKSNPLITAVRKCDASEVKRICLGEADINARDEHDWSALNWAAEQGDVEVIQILIEHGADVLATGKDLRWAYQIALDAGKVDAAEMLAHAEADARSSLPGERLWHPYCRAYPLSDLTRFPGWPASAQAAAEAASDDKADDGEEPTVFIHDDLTVTRSIWHGEDVIFDDVTDDWRRFCTEKLGFSVPRERDMAPPWES